jgi:hypothetical protein
MGSIVRIAPGGPSERSIAGVRRHAASKPSSFIDILRREPRFGAMFFSLDTSAAADC